MRRYFVVVAFLLVSSVAAQDKRTVDSSSIDLPEEEPTYLIKAADIEVLTENITVDYVLERNGRIRKNILSLAKDPSKLGDGLQELDYGYMIHLEKHPDLFRIEDVFSAFVGNLKGRMKGVLFHDLRQMGLPVADEEVLDRWSELTEVPYLLSKEIALERVRSSKVGSGIAGSKISDGIGQAEANSVVAMFYDEWANARIELTVSMLNELSLQGQRVVLKLLFESEHYRDAHAVFEFEVNPRSVDAIRKYGF